MQRRVVQMRMRGFLALLQGAQAHLNATGQVPPELDGTEFFLQTQRAQVNAHAPHPALNAWTTPRGDGDKDARVKVRARHVRRRRRCSW